MFVVLIVFVVMIYEISYLTDEFVALWFPRWRFARRGVELVVEQREGLLARQSVAGEQRAVPDRELDLDVDAVSDASLDERRPQPVVDVVVGHVANHVGPPVYALLEVRIALLYPLKQMHLPVIDDLSYTVCVMDTYYIKLVDSTRLTCTV